MKMKKKCLFWLVLSSTVTLLLIAIIKHRARLLVRTEVEGWPQSRSRNIRDYVNEHDEPHVLPRNFCVKNEFLLVVVMSKPDHFKARNIIRETWAQKRANVTFVFLLGETRNNFYQKSELELEIQRYNDIIQENFIDHYNNLTLKTVNMLKIFRKYCSSSHQYLMKVDDDILLNIVGVMDILQKISATNVLLGRVPISKPYRDTSSKWYVPYEWYPEENYPDYVCGPSYVMSSDVVEKLFQCSLETPLFYIEDVYLGICAKKINLVPQNNNKFNCYHQDKDACLNKEDVVFHLYKSEDVKYYYKLIIENECENRTRWRDWIPLFDFF